jgi:hypothetical protein
VVRSLALSFMIYMAPIVALAAPVPPPTEKEQIAKLWGKTIAPSDDYEFKLNGKALTIRTTGEPTLRGTPDRPETIPRVCRTVKGDFQATVRLVALASPNPKAEYDRGIRETRAGLQIAWADTSAEIELKQHYFLNQAEYRDSPQQTIGFYVRSGANGEGRHSDYAKPPTPLYLRIARRQNSVTLWHSSQGTEWCELKLPRADQPLELPDEVSINVYVAHTTHQVVDAVFTDFTIEKLK